MGRLFLESKDERSLCCPRREAMKFVISDLLAIGLTGGLVVALTGAENCIAQDAKTAQRPNVIHIYTDDHARWAVGAYGNKEIHTPDMDRLAAQGMRFTQAFTKPVCSPSRAMVLTGQYSPPTGNPGLHSLW